MAREALQRVSAGQRGEVTGIQRGAQGQVFGAGEGLLLAGGGDAVGGNLAQTIDQSQAQAHGGVSTMAAV